MSQPANGPSAGRGAGWLFLLIIFCSGWSALTYQIAWERILVVNFGVDFHSVSAITAAFLTGLGIGALVVGKIADRTPRPLLLYGWIEIAIALTGFASLFVLPALYPVATHLQRTVDSPALYFVLNFLLVLAVMLPPTVLMGGTLPVMVRHVVARLGPGRTIGRLYGINTMGSVLGCIAAPFVTISLLGISGAIVFAAAFNLIVGIVAVLVGRRAVVGTEAHTTVEPAASAAVNDASAEGAPGTANTANPANPANVSHPPTAGVRWLLGLYLVASFVAVAWQIVWYRVFSLQWQNSTGGFAVMLSWYLLGIALAGVVYARLSGRIRFGVRFFASLQLLAAGLSLFGLWFFSQFGRRLWHGSEESLLIVHQRLYPDAAEIGRRVEDTSLSALASAIASLSLIDFLMITLPMIMQGMTFPLVATLVVRRRGQTGASVGRVYVISIIGSFVGAFAGGHLLIPYLGLRIAIIVLVGLSTTIGLLAWWRATRMPATTDDAAAEHAANEHAAASPRARLAATPGPIERWLPRVAAASAFAGIAWIVLLPVSQFRASIMAYGSVIDAEEGITGAAIVVGNDDYTAVQINGQTQGAIWPFRLSRDDAKASLAVNLHPDPERVMLVGLGNGRTLAAFERYAEIDRIDVVEISRELPILLGRIGEIDRAAWLKRALESPKTNIIPDDGRMFLNRTDERYDIIATAAIFSHNAYGGYLYSREFLEVVRDSLTEDGIFVMLNDALVPTMRFTLIQTFKEVFPHFVLDTGNYLYGSMRPLEFDRDRVTESWNQNRQWLAATDSEASQGRVNLAEFGATLNRVRSNEHAFADVTGFDINTDLRPWTEFWLMRFDPRANAMPSPQSRRSLAWSMSAVSTETLEPVRIGEMDLTPAALHRDRFGKPNFSVTDGANGSIQVSVTDRTNLKLHTGVTRLTQPPGSRDGRTDPGPITLAANREYAVVVRGRGEGVLQVQVRRWNPEAKDGAGNWDFAVQRRVGLSGGEPAVVTFTGAGEAAYRVVLGFTDPGDWMIDAVELLAVPDTGDEPATVPGAPALAPAPARTPTAAPASAPDASAGQDGRG
ncbi:MAG: fused MFS/spermidine synthase [Phycisphaerales bacterium]